jgi:hypothetical protein
LYTHISEFVNKITVLRALIGGGPFLPAADRLGGGRTREDVARQAAARPTENGKPVATALRSSALE